MVDNLSPSFKGSKRDTWIYLGRCKVWGVSHKMTGSAGKTSHTWYILINTNLKYSAVRFANIWDAEENFEDYGDAILFSPPLVLSRRAPVEMRLFRAELVNFSRAINTSLHYCFILFILQSPFHPSFQLSNTRNYRQQRINLQPPLCSVRINTTSSFGVLFTFRTTFLPFSHGISETASNEYLEILIIDARSKLSETPLQNF